MKKKSNLTVMFMLVMLTTSTLQAQSILETSIKAIIAMSSSNEAASVTWNKLQQCYDHSIQLRLMLMMVTNDSDRNALRIQLDALDEFHGMLYDDFSYSLYGWKECHSRGWVSYNAGMPLEAQAQAGGTGWQEAGVAAIAKYQNAEANWLNAAAAATRLNQRIDDLKSLYSLLACDPRFHQGP